MWMPMGIVIVISIVYLISTWKDWSSAFEVYMKALVFSLLIAAVGTLAFLDVTVLGYRQSISEAEPEWYFSIAPFIITLSAGALYNYIKEKTNNVNRS